MGRTKKPAEQAEPKKNGLAVAIASFEVETDGNQEKVTILRIGDRFAWRWDYAGKSYGDFVTQPPFKEPDLEKRIAELTKRLEEATPGRKIKLAKQLKDLIEFYEQLKTEDVSNLLSVLMQQADETIDKIKGKS